MAQGKKISELTELSSVTDNDEFLFVDKEGSGANSGNGGSNVKIKFSDLKMAITDGMKGEQEWTEKKVKKDRKVTEELTEEEQFILNKVQATAVTFIIKI